MNNKLKYVGYSIVLQEIPDEVTLAINISGCPHRCEGCHSAYLWEHNGYYISEDLEDLMEKYKGLISCVCFMGGTQNQMELGKLLLYIKQHNLKTALYTGLDSMNDINTDVLENLDYCKVGHYNQSVGGLNNRNTNQRMFKRDLESNGWNDITYKFWKEERTNEDDSKS